MRWLNLSVEPEPYTTLGSDCLGIDIREATCDADITADGLIDVQDLLAVVNNWGSCWADSALGGTCSNPGPCDTPAPCLVADIAPARWGDGTVNVQDMLAVINAWGTCPQTATLDQEVDDCFDYATEELELEPYTQEWLEAVEQCLKGAYGLL